MVEEKKNENNEKNNIDEKLESLVKVNVIHNGKEYKKGDKIKANDKKEFEQLKANGII